MTFIFDLLILTFVQLISLFGILIVVGFLIHIIERQSVRFIYKSFGLRGLLVHFMDWDTHSRTRALRYVQNF